MSESVSEDSSANPETEDRSVSDWQSTPGVFPPIHDRSSPFHPTPKIDGWGR
jgi:hypothetical protein